MSISVTNGLAAAVRRPVEGTGEDVPEGGHLSCAEGLLGDSQTACEGKQRVSG